MEDYFQAFDDYVSATRWADFKTKAISAGWRSLGIGIDAAAAYSPRASSQSLLQEIAAEIDGAKSSVFFSLAFLHQTVNGPIGPALGRALERNNLHVLGIADGRVKDENFGLVVLTPDRKRRVVRSAALTGNVPPPFLTEPSSLTNGENGFRGTRMHHKFVVVDFDTDNPRVYAGSHNFSEPADDANGENLVRVRDRTVATSYMIEALRIYDHYVFRAAVEDAKK